jgi:hypothetical protein
MTPDYNALKASRDWIEKQNIGGQLDTVISSAISHAVNSMTVAQLQSGCDQVANLFSDLVKDKDDFVDCDYSNEGVEVAYAAAFHAKRIHDAMAHLPFLAESMRSAPGGVLEIGSGTGAVLWTWTLGNLALREAGHANKTSTVHAWTCVESSQAMLGLATLLRNRLDAKTDHTGQHIQMCPSIISTWQDFAGLPLPLARECFVIASYPFGRNEAQSMPQDWLNLLTRISATGFAVWTRSAKTQYLASIQMLCQQAGWTVQVPGSKLHPWRSGLYGELSTCAKTMRDALGRDHPILPKMTWGGAPSDAQLLWMTAPRI